MEHIIKYSFQTRYEYILNHIYAFFPITLHIKYNYFHIFWKSWGQADGLFQTSRVSLPTFLFDILNFQDIS